MAAHWEFWIDVGGTFTDCLGRGPDGQIKTVKVLSSGHTKGSAGMISAGHLLHDVSRADDPAGFWQGAKVRFLTADGETLAESRVTDSLPVVRDADDRNRMGRLICETVPAGVSTGTLYELDTGEEAPVLAVRKVLGLTVDAAFPAITVKLGTTRGTNALLTRCGARTAFVTTRGFADVLRIANQDRPGLFDLAIRKSDPLFESVLEVDERIDAQGHVLKSPDPEAVRRGLCELRAAGIESIAICLLHAFADGRHERIVERIARAAGFREVSISSQLAPLIRIVSRGDTTVLDAYLNPVLRDYVERIQMRLGPQSRLRMMTSAGGLVAADSFSGRDSLLSGPAGGVIGFSRIATQAGFQKSIGFDMGGTSTDVSRFDGRYELEYETLKAGVRIAAPMLAIETVAAGGGSVCGFDGVKLFVGPQSAGADPGPACYGRGGPLTLTDVNLFLGRILPEEFPFPLDSTVVEGLLAAMCSEIAAAPLGGDCTVIELAEGFLQIANASMVRAIRHISVAKGYDPADYALVTFGGAGAQHACALARQLRIRNVLVHPLAGILSAYGIGLADIRRFAERTVLQPLSRHTLEQLKSDWEQLEAGVLAEVRSEGVPDNRVDSPVRSLDLRYEGVESTINITQPDDGDYRTAYEIQHQQLYGYRHSGRRLEVVVARVQVTGRMPDVPSPQSDVIPRKIQATRQTDAYFNGAGVKTGVFRREQLCPGDSFTGPAIVSEPASTVVIDPGFQASILAGGEILIQESSDSNVRFSQTVEGLPQRDNHSSADPVLLEIFNNLFASIAEQMGVTLQKTSLSTNVKERLDFSCAIFTPAGDLVVNAPHIPVHLGAMSETVRHLLSDEPDIRPGDVFMTNDPFRGGSHLPDVTVITPVHDQDSGQLMFFTASRAHHSEIGGIVPGSMPPFSKNLAEEGVLIRCFRIVEEGCAREDKLRKLLAFGPAGSRSIENNLADISAQIAANNCGAKLLAQLVERYSLPRVHDYMAFIQRAAAEKMRMALRSFPDGTYESIDYLDDGSPIQAVITIDDDMARVDFTGTGPVLTESNLNANRAIVTAAVLYVFRCLIVEDIPLNAGVLEPVSILLPECLLNPPARDNPAECVAVVGGNVETSQRVVDVLLAALGVAAGSQGTMNNLTFGDSSFGYYETLCGGSGATPDASGADAVHTHMTNTRLTDVEVIERRFPVRIREFSVRRGSGGQGRFRGGDGIVRRIEFLRPLSVSILSERRGSFAPRGLNGGADGKRGINSIQWSAGGSERLSGKVQLDVDTGDVLTIETPGGGGCGQPATG